ncbi:MAG TPA: pyruvate dehydrogenase complex dihydrolipoamide acetyltransferase [Hyphomicrobiales bacterium]|nr:pyruvate dehydrogenase complex dihydrolipoamide acetyltransferase [Hyphomicrobiales bacterium]
MPTNILMPALSPTMEKGNLAKWLKKEGDPVRSGDVIAEIETDKATMEVEAVDEGTLGKILVAEGTEDVPVNQPIAVLIGEGEDPNAAAPPPAVAPAPKAEAPKAAEASKSSAPSAEPAAAPSPPSPAVPAPQPPRANGAGRVFASPLARRLAKEAGIDLAALRGSGPHGRIVKHDIEGAQAGGGARRAPSAAPGAAPAAQPAVAPMGDDRIRALYAEGSYDLVPHDGMRKTIARRLVEAKATIPHYYLTADIDLDLLMAAREEVNSAAPKGEDGKPVWRVSVNDFIIKALALALMKVPEANVTWTEGAMLRHHQADIGVAVALPGGLITPIVRNAERKTLSAISIEMKDLAARARARKLKPNEYEGGSSAVSNLGMYGVKEFSAVINPPHSSILAVGTAEKRAVVRAGQLAVATQMTATLSADHRAVDGALGAELLMAFRGFIEKPLSMLA